MGEINWKNESTEMFYRFKVEAERYNQQNEDIKELAILNAGKAAALSELLEKFGCRPMI